MRTILAIVLLLAAANAYANENFYAAGRFPEGKSTVLTLAASSDNEASTVLPTFGLTMYDTRHQAKVLMDLYGLLPSSLEPSVFRMKLANTLPPFQSMISASKKIGYDLAKFVGTEIEEHRYRLKQKSESGGDIDAVFLFNDGKTVGAFLVLIGYLGGVSSLKDHSQFAK